MDWSYIEPSLGVYQWNRMDQWINEAFSMGKVVNLAIRGGGGTAGTATPGWLFSAARATSLNFDVSAHQGQGGCIPETIAAPWDLSFLNSWDNMLLALSDHLANTYVISILPITELQVVSMIRLTGINRTTDEFRLPEQTPATLASCGANPPNSIQTWLYPPNNIQPYTPQNLQFAWTSLTSDFQQLFPGMYFNLPIIPDNTGSGGPSNVPQNPFPEIDENGCVYDPPVDPTQLNPPPCIDTGFSGVDQNAPLLAIASQDFEDHLAIEFESLDAQHPANTYVVQEVQTLNGGNTGAAFMTNQWAGNGAACSGGPGTGKPCKNGAAYFNLLLEPGIYLPKPTSIPRFRSQYLEVFWTDVLRGPDFPCAIWQAHIDLTDYTVPVTTATIMGTKLRNGNYRAPVTIDLSATDDSTTGQPAGCSALPITTQYSVNNGAWTTGTSVSISTLGTHAVAFYSTDVAGNAEALQTITVTLVK